MGDLDSLGRLKGGVVSSPLLPRLVPDSGPVPETDNLRLEMSSKIPRKTEDDFPDMLN